MRTLTYTVNANHFETLYYGTMSPITSAYSDLHLAEAEERNPKFIHIACSKSVMTDASPMYSVATDTHLKKIMNIVN